VEPALWSIKYSPQAWDDFVGQDDAISQLRKLAESKTGQNMIFCGPAGTGKSCAAFVFSRALLGDTFTANFKYLNVRDLRETTVAKAKRDLQTLSKLERSERTELDEYMSAVYKEAKADLALKGHTGEPNKSQLLHEAIRLFASTITVSDEMVKYLVLDEADALDRNMQQALRRTMEMYSDACRFILTTPSLAGWNTAVVSRCLVVRFPAPQDDVVEKLLRTIATKERVKCDDKAFRAIARESSGDMRRAINLLQVCAAGVQSVTEDVVYESSENQLNKDVREMVSLVVNGSFAQGRDLMKRLLAVDSYGPDEICIAVQADIMNRPLDSLTTDRILQRIADIEYRITQAKNPFVHLSALLASIGEMTSAKTA